MNSSLYILLFVLINAASLKAVPVASLVQSFADKTLIDYYLQRGVIGLAEDPVITQECFNKYLPLLTQTAITFSKQYETCITTSDERTANLTSQAAQSRAQYRNITNGICTNFSTCASETDMLSFLKCYSAVSGNNIEELYAMSSNAANAAIVLQQGLRNIKLYREQCTNDAEQTYVIVTAKTYDLLTNCLQNGPEADATNQTVKIALASTGVSAEDYVAGTPCSNTSAAHTQTSSEGSQSQRQSGPGCQSQSGNQSQSQCSGVNCGEYQPLLPLFNMSTVAPLKPFEPIVPIKPLEPIEPII